MRVKDVMTKSPEVVAPEASLIDAAQTMRSLDVGVVPVCESDRLVGVVTDRDIVVRAAAEGKDPTKCLVADAMSAGVSYCFEDDDLVHATRIMEDKQVRRLPVLNQKKRLVGIVSLGDLAVSGDANLAGEVLKTVSQSTTPGSQSILLGPAQSRS